MHRSVEALRHVAPDAALAALALLTLTAAGTALGLPLAHYVGLLVVTVGSVFLARRVLGTGTRTAVETLATAVVLYASGWGPALGLAFVAPLIQATARTGAAGVRGAATWALVSIGIGQGGIHLGLVPSFIAVPAAHGVAGVGALALVAVARRLRAATAAREQAEAQARHGRARYQALVQHSSDVVAVLDDRGRMLEHSPAVTASLGYAPHTLDGVSYATLAHPEDAPAVTEALDAVVHGRPVGLTDARLRRRDGSHVAVEIAWSDLRQHPAVGAIVALARDVTERRSLEATLAHRAFHDELTGLANRAKFTDRVQHAVARAGRRPQRFAVAFLDLDGFKPINDTLGHEAGDLLLAEVADRLRGVVRDVDTPARFGGDEFAVLLEDLREDADAVRVAERIQSALRAPVHLDGATVHIDASIGIAVSTGTESAGDLLRNADIAMYSAKHTGKGRIEIFEPEMHLESMARLELERELAEAIGDDQLRLHYQPIVSLEDQRIVGVEALVRWEHPTRGLVGPDDFVPIAEESGLIIALGRWVLTRACAQVADWQRRYPQAEPLRLNVNVSARQLLSGDLVADVARAVAASALDPRSLTLEITESAVLQDTDATLHTLRELKYLGVDLAIDDFGTGYSALGYLQKFPFDELKIDRSFVAALTDGTGQPALLQAIVDIGRSLQLRTVAEGIEHAEQAARTRRLRCDLGQGWLFARPADATVTEARLAQGRATLDAAAPRRLKVQVHLADTTSHGD